jgi:antibiotic biosynthesis monooxygenase (ABM) superfamily enzyme
VLRYSARLALLKEAERRGLGRFEANLVIAGVLYRAGMGQEYEMRPHVEWVAPVLTFLVLQAALIVGAWWVLG